MKFSKAILFRPKPYQIRDPFDNLRGYARSVGLGDVTQVSTYEHIEEMVSKDNDYVLFFIDHPRAPILEQLKNIQTKVPIAILPKIAITSRSTTLTARYVQSIGKGICLEEGFTYTSFQKALDNLHFLWKSKDMTMLYEEFIRPNPKTLEEQINAMSNIMAQSKLKILTIPHLAHLLNQYGDSDTAEKILIELLKANPGDGVLISCLCELYALTSRPHFSIRLLSRLPETLSRSDLMIMDWIVALFMTEKFEDISEIIKEKTMREGYYRPYVNDLLAVRGLFTERPVAKAI